MSMRVPDPEDVTKPLELCSASELDEHVNACRNLLAACVDLVYEGVKMPGGLFEAFFYTVDHEAILSLHPEAQRTLALLSRNELEAVIGTLLLTRYDEKEYWGTPLMPGRHGHRFQMFDSLKCFDVWSLTEQKYYGAMWAMYCFDLTIMRCNRPLGNVTAGKFFPMGAAPFSRGRIVEQAPGVMDRYDPFIIKCFGHGKEK